MNHTTNIRGKLALAGSIAATFSVAALLIGCCLSSPNRTLFFCLYQFSALDQHGLLIWSILIASALLIAIGIYRLLQSQREEPEAIGVRLLPGLIGGILSTAFALMVTPAGSFIYLRNPETEVSKMAWLTLLVMSLLFIGCSVSWLLIRERLAPRPEYTLISPSPGNTANCC